MCACVFVLVPRIHKQSSLIILICLFWIRQWLGGIPLVDRGMIIQIHARVIWALSSEMITGRDWHVGNTSDRLKMFLCRLSTHVRVLETASDQNITICQNVFMHKQQKQWKGREEKQIDINM